MVFHRRIPAAVWHGWSALLYEGKETALGNDSDRNLCHLRLHPHFKQHILYLQLRLLRKMVLHAHSAVGTNDCLCTGTYQHLAAIWHYCLSGLSQRMLPHFFPAKKGKRYRYLVLICKLPGTFLPGTNSLCTLSGICDSAAPCPEKAKKCLQAGTGRHHMRLHPLYGFDRLLWGTDASRC